MSSAPPIPPATPAASSGMKVLGVLFIIFWLAGHVLWGCMAFMANVMANGSGAASAESQIGLIVGMLVGQLIAAAGGVPAGLAFFKPGRRKRLLLWFAILFIVGALLQAGALYQFFSGVS